MARPAPACQAISFIPHSDEFTARVDEPAGSNTRNSGEYNYAIEARGRGDVCSFGPLKYGADLRSI